MGVFAALFAFLSLFGLGQGGATRGGGSDRDDSRDTEQDVARGSDPDEPLASDETSLTRADAIDDGYTIDILYEDNVPTVLRESFEKAADTLETLIEGDVAGTDTIDDLQVTVSVRTVDGEGQTLARSLVNEFGADDLPVDVDILVDRSDLDTLIDADRLDALVLHEMIHAVGFGVSWERQGLIGEDADGNPVFTGENATEVFAEMTGETGDVAGVPLEQNGSQYTAHRHWDEGFTGELMIGYLTNASTVSELTQASLADIGHDIQEIDPDDWDARLERVTDDLLI